MAARSDYRPLPVTRGSMSLAARSFAYVLLLVSFTAVAALGGYEIGSRRGPSAADVSAARATAAHHAVVHAVARRAARDRALRRRALAEAMRFQRERDLATVEQRVIAQQRADAVQAARAYRRGRAVAVAKAKRPAPASPAP